MMNFWASGSKTEVPILIDAFLIGAGRGGAGVGPSLDWGSGLGCWRGRPWFGADAEGCETGTVLGGDIERSRWVFLCQETA